MGSANTLFASIREEEEYRVEKARAMRFLVTGGAGFIGSHLVDHLVGANHDVVVVDDLSTGLRSRIEPYLDRIRFVEGSIVDPDVCRDAMRGVEFIFHQAAIPSVPRSVNDPARTHAANTTGTLNLLIAARDAGVKRFVYAGSSSAYGDTTELPKRETMPPRPRSPYAVQKLCGEQYCSAFFTTYGLETITLRYFNVFGPGQDPASQYAAVVPRFITAALAESAPVIFGDGEQTRDFTYIENVVQANMLALDAPADALGRVFNIGCGDRITVNALWQEIASAIGVEIEPTYVPTRAGDVRDSLASLDLAHELLSYEPRVGLREGLERTVASFRLPADTEA